MLYMPTMHSRVAFRIKQRFDIAPCNRTKGGRRVGRAEDSCTRFCNRLVERIGQNRHAVNVAQFALIGTKT